MFLSKPPFIEDFPLPLLIITGFIDRFDGAEGADLGGLTHDLPSQV